jgi:hypothetical protein
MLRRCADRFLDFGDLIGTRGFLVFVAAMWSSR